MDFIIWKDGGNSEAVVISAADMPDGVEQAAELLGVEAEQVNIIEASRIGEADYYGVSHALKG
ncbi:hypothetical protein [Salinicola endophyticus]|uniref:Uncharacterized protein n=1 Tax=Salinicola endophyticus TaxID=1949083 RepID=A0AB74UI32_9GAMM